MHYKYEAMTSSGQEVVDTVEANSHEEAISIIRGRGEYPTKIKASMTKEATQRVVKQTKRPSVLTVILLFAIVVMAYAFIQMTGVLK